MQRAALCVQLCRGQGSYGCLGSSRPQRAHPIAADAEVAVAELDGLLGADHRLSLVPVVHLRACGDGGWDRAVHAVGIA